jgi:hypothetical protein
MSAGAPLYLRAEPQRLPRATTVAIDARPLCRARSDASSAAGQPLWWPPAKIAARYLAPYLATARSQPLISQLLADRPAVAAPPVCGLSGTANFGWDRVRSSPSRSGVATRMLGASAKSKLRR